MSLSPQWLDELRTRTSLSGLIRRTVKLQRAGNEWKACCPFHNEKTPSFYVNDDKGFYHCFGCEAHGDALRWMTDQRGLAFMDAVKELAAEAGLDLPPQDPVAAKRAERRAGLHDVLQAAQDWFAANLASAEGIRARDYLSARGLGGSTLAGFGFGWAPDKRGALKEALGHFGEPLLIEAGLLIAAEDKEPYDRFRARVMLPIHDARSRVIAFGGRILDASSTSAPKYLNSPDTPLFDKGRTLYNLHRAGPVARRGGRIVVVEGYMDVIALAAAGLEEAVAPMGTALTEQQLELLWRVADKPVLCLDGDEAGQRAAMRAVGRALPLLQPGRSLEIAHLPAGLDPDDLVRRDGKAALEQLLAARVTLLDTIWEHERAALPLATPEDKAGLKARLLAQVEAIADNDIRALYRRELLDRFSAFAFPPRERPQQAGGGYAQAKGQRRSGQKGERWGQLTIGHLAPEHAAEMKRSAEGGARDLFTQAILAGLDRHPDQIARHSETLLQLAAADPRTQAAVDQLLEQAQALEAHGKCPISAPDLLAPPPGNSRFSFLEEGHNPDDVREDLAEALTLLVERPALEIAIRAATARFDEDPEGAFAEQQRLRKRKLEIEGRLGQMARRRAASAVTEQDSSALAHEAEETRENGLKRS